MEPVGDLSSMWESLARGPGIQSASVSADDFHSRMLFEPARHAGRRAVGQDIHDRTPFEIHNDRAVAGSASPAPVIYSRDPEWPVRDSSGVAFEVMENAIVASRHAKAVEETICGPATGGMTNKSR